MSEKKKVIIKIGSGSGSVIKVVSSTHDVEIHKVAPGKVGMQKVKLSGR